MTRKEMNTYMYESYEFIKKKLELKEYNEFEGLYLQSMSYLIENIEADTQKANAYFLENISLFEENEILIEQLKEKNNEIAKLRKMVAKGHHIQCACSFCNSGAGFIYGSDFKDEN